MSKNWNDVIAISSIFRVRIDFKNPPMRLASEPGGDDFEFESDWRNRIESLMHEIHAVGNDADTLQSSEGIDVVGLDPYVVAEFSTLECAQATVARICDLIVLRGGSVVDSESPADHQEDGFEHRNTERARA